MTDETSSTPDPDAILDELVAAPENETQIRKAKVRKAKELARVARLRNAKKHKDDLPDMEDLLRDIVRVAEDPETNPNWYEFRSISRERYLLFGDYPIEHVDKLFGQFEHAKQIAGLSDKLGTRLWRAGRAHASRNEHAVRYLERYVRPYVKEPDPELERPKLLLSISDTHSTFLCPFTWHCFLSAIRDLKPDVVYLNGDILEGAEMGRYDKIPGWTVPLQLEFDFAREMFRQIREVFDGELWWGGGNHGIDRIARYMTQVARELAGLRSLRFDKLAGLEDLAVNLAQGGTIMSPDGTEEHQAGILLYDFYRIHHGTKLGQTPYLQELRSAGYSGQTGHVHRAGVAHGTTQKDMALSWMSTPMGCTSRAGRAYMKDPNMGWQSGFGVCWLFPNGQVRQYPVITDGGVCHVEGYVYERIESPDPDPSTLWLPSVPVPK